MDTVHFQALIFILVSWTGTRTLRWTDNVDDRTVYYVCDGGDLRLSWNFTSPPEEAITSIQWFYRGQSEELLGTSSHESFKPTATFAHRVEFLPEAGILLKNFVPADEGNYSVEIIAHDGSQYISEVRSVLVATKEPPITDDGDHLVVGQAVVYDNDTDQWSIELSCGHFTNLGQPPVDIVWTTPSGGVAHSTSYEDSNFYLLVPNPFKGGQYSCSVSPQSTASTCLPSSSSLLKTDFNVSECDGRQSIVEAYQAENKLLKEKESSMAAEIGNLTQQVKRYAELVEQAAGEICGSNYTVLDDYTRHVTFGSGDQLCDRDLAPGWYRFFINGTNAVIPTSCPPEDRCGTLGPIWLDLQTNALPGATGEVRVQAYARNDNNCRWRQQPDVTIRNCGTYFVYRLTGTNGCYNRYCATTD